MVSSPQVVTWVIAGLALVGLASLSQAATLRGAVTDASRSVVSGAAVRFLFVNNALDPVSVTLDAPLDSASIVLASQPSPSFGRATKAADPRQAQFGVKLIF